MSEYIDYFPKDIDEAVYFTPNVGAVVEQRKRMHGMLKVNEVEEPYKVDWLQQYFENHTAPRAEVAWIMAAKAFFGQVDTDELIVDPKNLTSAGHPPNARFMTIPDGTEGMHGLDVHILGADPSLADDLVKLAAERPFVVDETEFRRRVLECYYEANIVLRLQHSVAGEPYNASEHDNYYIYGNEMFGFKPQDEITFERGERLVLPATKNWRDLVNCVAAVEVATLRAEAVASSLRHAWRIDGKRGNIDSVLSLILGSEQKS